MFAPYTEWNVFWIRDFACLFPSSFFLKVGKFVNSLFLVFSLHLFTLEVARHWYYKLFFTRYLLLFTRYRYFTGYLLFFTRYSLHFTRYSLLFTRYMSIVFGKLYIVRTCQTSIMQLFCKNSKKVAWCWWSSTTGYSIFMAKGFVLHSEKRSYSKTRPLQSYIWSVRGCILIITDQTIWATDLCSSNLAMAYYHLIAVQ